MLAKVSLKLDDWQVWCLWPSHCCSLSHWNPLAPVDGEPLPQSLEASQATGCNTMHTQLLDQTAKSMNGMDNHCGPLRAE